MQNTVHANGISHAVRSSGMFAYQSGREAALRCDACSAPFSNGLTAARSHTPDTTIRTAPPAQNSATLFFLCLPLQPPG